MPRTSRCARLLLGVVLLQLGVALAWLVREWPASPLRAVAGAVLVASIASIVLAIEFTIVGFISRQDALVPVPTAKQLLAAWMRETVLLFRVFYGRQAFRWRRWDDHLPAAGRGQCGVVFIHGFVCNRGFWAPWMRVLRAAGRPHVAVNLEPVFTSIDDYAAAVEDGVRRVTGCTQRPPILVCHSMGGLAARAWLRLDDNTSRVQRVITIGTPHHGTWLARFSHLPNGRQMRRDSAWLRQLEQDESGRPRPPWTCWYSNCDNVVFPASTATLPGADNRFVPGQAHVALAFVPEVMEYSLAAFHQSDSRLSR